MGIQMGQELQILATIRSAGMVTNPESFAKLTNEMPRLGSMAETCQQEILEVTITYSGRKGLEPTKHKIERRTVRV